MGTEDIDMEEDTVVQLEQSTAITLFSEMASGEEGQEANVDQQHNEDDNFLPEASQSHNKQKKKTSSVWEEMEEITMPDGTIKIRCNYCKYLFKKGKTKTTSTLKRHLEDICIQRKIAKGQIEADKRNKQTQLAGTGPICDGENSLANFKFDFARVRELAAHMVLGHEYPFLMMEHEIFNHFLKAYTPYYRKISRYTFKKDCLSTYQKEKMRIKNCMAKVHRVSLTTDCWWSNNQKISYMTVTGHFIDQNWQLQKRVLAFVNVPPPHSGVILAEQVHKVMHDWGITDRVVSISVDNASANDVCIRRLKEDFTLKKKLLFDGQLFHVRCCAHILNLLVKDGLKEIEDIIDSVRDGIKYLMSSEARLIDFNTIRKHLNLPKKKLVLDICTRWNSTYLMMSTAVVYKLCFRRYADKDEQFKQSNYCPSDVDWVKVGEVCDYLEVFNDVTNIISGSEYPTVNLILSELYRVKDLLNENLKEGSQKYLKSMAHRMEEKYDKYWKECNLLISLGAILDPRYKKDIIEYTFPLIYSVDAASRNEVFVSECLKNLYEEYVKIYQDNSSGAGSSSSSQPVVVNPSVGKRKFDAYLRNKRREDTEKSELDLYLEEICYPSVEGTPFDALQWWKANEGKYKVLSKVAKDILSIPITTVASEATFSAGGRVIDKKRA